jgi:hypothetical protein
LEYRRGATFDVSCDLDSVVVTCDAVEVARHRRCLAMQRNVLDPAHAINFVHDAHRTDRTPAFETAIEERDLAMMSVLPGWLRS